MPTNALTIPPPTPKAPARQVELASPPAKTAKAAGDRAPQAGSGEPKFGEALQKAEGRHKRRHEDVEAKPAPEPAQDRPEAAQIEPEATESSASDAAPTAEQVTTTAESPNDSAPAPSVNEPKVVAEPIAEQPAAPRSGAQSASQAIADQATATKLSLESLAPASAPRSSPVAPSGAKEPAAQQTAQTGEPAASTHRAAAATPSEAPVQTVGAGALAQAGSVESTEEPQREPATQFVAEARGTNDQPAEAELAPAAERTPAVRKAAVGAAPELLRAEAATPIETRKDGADGAILRALAGQPSAATGGAGGGAGAEGGQLKDERSGAASRAVEAAMKSSAAAPNSGAGGAERAAPVFTVGPPAAPDAQGAPATAQVRPESAALTTPTSAQEAFDAQVSRGLTAAVSQKGGVVTMRLQPEALGAVRIQMTIEQGVVQARFEAATPEARDLLNKHMETLRASLEAKGLSVDRLQVHLASPGHGGPGGQTGQNGSGAGQDAQRSWSHDATDGRSRGAFDHRPDGEDRQGGRGENRWSRAGAERWDDDGPDSGRRASVVRVGLDAVA